LLLLSVITTWALNANAQQAEKPIHRSGLVQAIKINGLSTQELVAIIRRRGVDFQLTPDAEQELRSVGARPEVIAAVRESYRAAVEPTPTPSNQTPVQPSAPTTQPERTNAVLPALATGSYYALVIGNNAYTSLPKLKTAEADAREIERLLRESYGFQTKLLVNATRSQTVAALSSYRHELTPDANLLIYYAGHGYNDKDADKAYWLPVDASRDDVSNWIIADEITTGIRVIPAKHILVISDSCYSGTLTRGLGAELPRPTEREQFLQRMAAGHSRTLMASGGDEPVADSGGGGHSVFASALMRGLSEMDKGQFTAAELFNNYVVEAVAGRAEQTPLYDPLRNSGHESGDFVFKRTGTSAAVAQPIGSGVNSQNSGYASPQPISVENLQAQLRPIYGWPTGSAILPREAYAQLDH